MIEILFEGHAQTHHNVMGVASGHYDIALTEVGREQARSVRRQRYADHQFDDESISVIQGIIQHRLLLFKCARGS